MTEAAFAHDALDSWRAAIRGSPTPPASGRRSPTSPGSAENGHDRRCGAVRRRLGLLQRREFAFVILSDPTGEYAVLFPPESLRRCRDLLEPGRAVALKVRVKARDGEVRFLGDDAEPVEKTIENAVAGIRVHLAPRRSRR